MPRYKIVIEYIGTNFYGSQWQPKKRTIQDELISMMGLGSGIYMMSLRKMGSGSGKMKAAGNMSGR